MQAQREAEAAASEAVGGQELCGEKIFDPIDPRPAPENVTAQNVTELETTDIRVGDGEEVQPGDCVAALYYGTLATDGTVFDNNYESGQTFEFSLEPGHQRGVIEGWQQGIVGMKVGGVRRIVIPAALAYGDQERGGIPANSDLVFEVELINTRRFE